MSFYGVIKNSLGTCCLWNRNKGGKAKVDTIRSLSTPKTIKDVRLFLGHTRFYRRFIQNFNKIANPLCELLAKDKEFVWIEQCEWGLQELKKLVTLHILYSLINTQNIKLVLLKLRRQNQMPSFRHIFVQNKGGETCYKDVCIMW